jgi:hypothetical protein
VGRDLREPALRRCAEPARPGPDVDAHASTAPRPCGLWTGLSAAVSPPFCSARGPGASDFARATEPLGGCGVMNRCGARTDASDLQSAPLSLSLGALALLGERHPASADESRGEFGEDRQNPRAAECGPAHGRGVELVAFDQLLVERLTRAGAVEAVQPLRFWAFGRRRQQRRQSAAGRAAPRASAARPPWTTPGSRHFAASSPGRLSRHRLRSSRRLADLSRAAAWS